MRTHNAKFWASTAPEAARHGGGTCKGWTPSWIEDSRLVRDLGRAQHASTEQLSALIDNRSEPDEQAFLAEHVGGCVVCASELADLRSVRAMLRAMPVYQPPRAFTIPVPTAMPAITPEVTATPAVTSASTTILQFVPRSRLVPFTRALSALAAVLCVVLFSADAMQTSIETAMPLQDGAGAMQITAARAPASSSGARSVAETEAASQPAEAQAAEAKPAAAPAQAAPAAQPAAAARSAPRAAAPPVAMSPQPAPAQAAASQPKPAVQPQGTVTAFAATQPAAIPTAPASNGRTSAAVPPPAADSQKTAQAAAPPPVGERLEPASATATTRGMTPLRVASSIFAVVAAILLVMSLALSRADRERRIADAWRNGQ